MRAKRAGGWQVRYRRYRRYRKYSRTGLPVVPVVAIAAVAAAVIGIAYLAVFVTAPGQQAKARNTAAVTDNVNMNCTLIVPANPLTAQGLATPYQLTATDPRMGPCNEANPNQSAFVQGAVINPATGQMSVYNPLVVNAGTQPAAAPVTPSVPAGDVAAVWFGFNGNVLTLAGADQVQTGFGRFGRVGQFGGGGQAGGGGQFGGGQFGAGTPAASAVPDAILQGANCVAGVNIQGQFSAFNQVGACNAQAFFAAANKAIQAKKLTVPNPGTAADGQACLTTRDFGLVDQDQSDNVTTKYLVGGNGQTAQDTAANQQALAGALTLFNGSDNGLLDTFVDPALGCKPWQVTDLASKGATATALPLDELQAASFAGRNAATQGPAALVPLNDPMTTIANNNLGGNFDQHGHGQAGGNAAANAALFSTGKNNAYRAIVDQPAQPAGETPAQYCINMENIQATRLQQDVNLTINQASPLPMMASNLFTFLGMRLQNSFTNLNCQNFGLRNQVTTTMNGNGVVIAVCFRNQVAPLTAGAGNPTAGLTVCPQQAGQPSGGAGQAGQLSGGAGQAGQPSSGA